MTSKEFTEKVASLDMGIWSDAARIALLTVVDVFNDEYKSLTDRTDLFVQHWVEQYDDPGSRPLVEKMLGEELTEFIRQQSINPMNENSSK